MSAWKCSDGHIQFVAEVLKNNAWTNDDMKISLNELIYTLDFFNQLSLNQRYGDDINITKPTPIEIDPSWHDSAVEKSQALSCYIYQASESDLFNTSRLVQWLSDIAKRYENQTPTMDNGTGHWGITTEELTQPRKALHNV